MSISVIIPTWNEANHIAVAIEALRVQNPLEIIVVDGGSTDATLRSAQKADVILSSAAGRAVQMNAGAVAAKGNILLFLHADCRLGPGSLDGVERVFSGGTYIGGCFSMHVDAQGMGFRSIDACATARVRLTGVVYGDQGLFVRREDFFRLGGYPQVRFMEDVFFSRRLRQCGRMIVLAHKIYVSSRRWRNEGLLRQTLRNWALTAAALAGVSPDRLARHYPHVR